MIYVHHLYGAYCYMSLLPPDQLKGILIWKYRNDEYRKFAVCYILKVRLAAFWCSWMDVELWS